MLFWESTTHPHTSSHRARKGTPPLHTSGHTKVQRWLPFLLLLLVGASRWAVSAARPATESTLASETIGCAWATLLAFAFLLPRRRLAAPQPSPSRAAIIRWLFAGATLFGGPAITLLIRCGDVESSALTIALAVTSIIIAVASSALGTESSEGIAGRIWPGLASIAGLLLVLVQPNLGDFRSAVALILAPTLTGIGAVLFCADAPGAACRIPTTLLGASTLFALNLAGHYVLAPVPPSLSLLAVAGDGILALLVIFTLNQLGATRWSSQFTWVPLLVILEGIALVRPRLTTHWFLGLL
ncbi:MAG: hypothetical protein M3Y72_05280, partial [Acidobacteriota bacterium]|nr:hypothetical protein [Acidobacteriota bacterium]